MSSSSLASLRAGALILCASGWTGASPADEPLPAAPPDLVERTRGAWIDIYTSWLESGDGRAVAVDPGPAFCLGTDGFVAVDQNAVAGSVHQFATIRGRGPFAARTRAFDPTPGLAAIQIHPGALEGVRCLEPAGGDAVPLAPGDVLFALGPPGAEPVALRVKKVSRDSLTFVGGLQGTFLAGSPLLDAHGLLRGVLVAGATGGRIGREQATGALAGLASRRHASRAIPLAPVLTLVEQLKKRRDEGVPVPPAGPIVRVSEEVFPNAFRGDPRVSAEDLALYSAKTEQAGVELLTPPSLQAQAARWTPIYSPGRSFFCFDRHVEMWEPMVVVQQAPQLEEAGGSTYTFPKSQGTITVERGDEIFESLDSFVDCFEDLIGVENAPGTYDPLKVKGCRTFYLFPPAAFAPGADAAVRVTLDKEEKIARVPIRPETQVRIAADFAPWQAAAGKSAEAVASGADTVLVPTPGIPYAMRLWGNAQLQFFTQEGYTYFATRLQRDGATVIRIPVILMKKWGPTFVPGLLIIGRDEISFEPLTDPRAEGRSFTAPRASVTVSATDWQPLQIKAGGKKWNFDPVVVGMRKLSLGDFFFGAGMKEAKAASARMSTWLAGDFDRAVRAFDEPDLLRDIPLKPAAKDEATPEEAP